MLSISPGWQTLTKPERDAIEAALHFVLAGEDPWESEVPEGSDGPSETWAACQSALRKL